MSPVRIIFKRLNGRLDPRLFPFCEQEEDLLEDLNPILAVLWIRNEADAGQSKEDLMLKIEIQ